MGEAVKTQATLREIMGVVRQVFGGGSRAPILAPPGFGSVRLPSVDVQADLLLLGAGNADVSLGGRDDYGLSRGGRAEFLGQVNLDDQNVAAHFHFDVLQVMLLQE